MFIICLFLILMHVTNFRNQLFSTWANDLEENLSTETCQRLVAAFQDHFNIDSPVLSAKQQRIVDFNFSLRRLLNEASMRLHQASLQLKEDNGLSSSNELMMVLLLLTYGNLTNLLVSFKPYLYPSVEITRVNEPTSYSTWPAACQLSCT